MGKKRVIYDAFVRISVPDGVDPHQIESVLHNAASGQGWDFSCTVEEEEETSPWFQERILEEDD